MTGGLRGLVLLRSRWTVGIALVSVLIAGTGWWATHDHRFSGISSYVIVPAHVGQPVAFGMSASPDGGPVTLQDVRALVREGSARARVEVVLCPGGWGIGASRDPVSTLCSERPRLHGARYSGLADGSALLVVVTALQPGDVDVDGVQVRYRDGWRWGSDVTGVHATLRATAA